MRFGAASFWVSKQQLVHRINQEASFGAASFWVSKQLFMEGLMHVPVLVQRHSG